MYVIYYVVCFVRYSMTTIKAQNKGSAQKDKNYERDLPIEEDVVVEEEEEEEETEEEQYEENRVVVAKHDSATKVSVVIFMCSSDVTDHKQDGKKTEDKKAVVSVRSTRNNKVRMLNYIEWVHKLPDCLG